MKMAAAVDSTRRTIPLLILKAFMAFGDFGLLIVLISSVNRSASIRIDLQINMLHKVHPGPFTICQ